MTDVKLVFLDIDYVLNSDDYDRSEEYKMETLGMSSAEVMLIAHHLHLDPKAVALMNELVERSGAEVILSSTWRVKYNPEQMTEMLAGRGGTFKIKDVTPQIHGRFSEHVPRGKEIDQYLKNLSEPVKSFVILDDRDDMIHLKPNLIQTSFKRGLTKELVEKALEILNKK